MILRAVAFLIVVQHSDPNIEIDGKMVVFHVFLKGSFIHCQTDSKFCYLPKMERQTDSNLESCIRENVFPFQKSLASQLACLWCSSVTGDRSYRCELCLRARKVSVFGVHDV